jgi:hypothetical protein
VVTVFEVRDEIWEAVEPMIPPVKVPERRAVRGLPLHRTGDRNAAVARAIG